MESLGKCSNNTQEDRMCRMILPNDLRSLLLAERVVESVCQQIKIKDSETTSILLATSEALCNVIQYGYGEETGRDIIFDICVNRSVLTIRINDEGIEVPNHIVQQYHNATVSMPSVDGNIEELPESGWGVNMLIIAAEEVRYSRTMTGNQLEIDFRIS